MGTANHYERKIMQSGHNNMVMEKPPNVQLVN